jgi:hypothetical protein
MMSLASALVCASAAIIAFLGAAHLLFTFYGPKLRPREAALEGQMQAVSPGLTRQTTMWRAWIGFNASHSVGALLFGLVYGYLAVQHGPMLFESTFLKVLGVAVLASYVMLAKAYWFHIPLRGAALALALYMAALVVG